MTLPLLKLPYLALKAILNTTGFLELFFLTQVSKRMEWIIKNHVKIRNHRFNISIHNDVSFELISPKSELPVSSIVLKPTKKLEASPFISYFDLKFEKCGRIPCISTNLGFGFSTVELYCDDFTLAKDIHDKIHDIFRIPIENVKVDLSDIRDKIKWTVGWLNNLTFPKIEISGYCYFADYIDTIQSVRSSGRVMFSAKPVMIYELGVLNVNLEHITFHRAEWFRPHYLESLNSRFIGISPVSFSDWDINQFLHSVKRGAYPNLREATLELKRRVAADNIFAGLDAVEDAAGWNFYLENGKQCSVWYGVYNNTRLWGIEVVIVDN
ncbi:unnamed protein product [Caenorhabditis brenneri]